MSFGKMNAFIEIIKVIPAQDGEGFSAPHDEVLANIRAYKEERHGNEKWANRAAFSSATALFCFRKIPDLDVNPSLVIICDGKRYEIHSVEDVRNRGMYIEVLAEEIQPTGR